MSLSPTELADLRAEYLDLFARAAALLERCDEIKAKIRANLPEGSYTPANGGTVIVSANRRFDEETARKVLPPNLIELVEVAIPATRKIDATRARNVLAPTLYDACRKTVGEPKVLIK